MQLNVEKNSLDDRIRKGIKFLIDGQQEGLFIINKNLPEIQQTVIAILIMGGGSKIPAIKWFRSKTGAGLRTSKLYVDELMYEIQSKLNNEFIDMIRKHNSDVS